MNFHPKLECADRAIELDPKFAGGFSLKAKLKLREAPLQTDDVKREKYCTEAVEAAKESTLIADTDDPEYANYYLRRNGLP